MVNLNDKFTTEENKIATQERNEFLAIKLNTMDDVELPPAHTSEPDRATRFEYKIMSRITLHSMKNGFFGRTYQTSQISLDPTTLKPVGDQINEYVLFYSKFKDADLHAITEFVLIIREKSAQQIATLKEEENKSMEEKKAPVPEAPVRQSQQVQKVLGIGFCVLPLYKEGNAFQDPGVK